jgi:chromosome partitioning protein
MVITYVNGKGGVGKSTFCFLTALGLRQAGKSVSIEDRDPQKSISAWVSAERDGILKNGQGEFHLIDTRPAIDNDSVHEAISIADRIIIPSTPSPGDLSAVKATCDVVNQFKRKGAKVFIGLNCVRPGTNFSQDAPEILSALGIPLLQNSLPDRQSVQRAVLLGWKAMDSVTQTAVFKLTLEIVS